MTTITGLTSIVEWRRGSAVLIPTEHNRSELSVDVNRIKTSDRMENGRLREYFVADKRTWSLSWSMLPAPSEETIDGRAGGDAIEQFYRNTPTEFELSVKHADPTLDYSATVTFVSFDKTHIRRGAHDFWDISVSMEEC